MKRRCVWKIEQGHWWATEEPISSYGSFFSNGIRKQQCLRSRDHDSCIIYLKARWKIVLTSKARPGKAFVRHALGCCYCRCCLHRNYRKWLPSPRYVCEGALDWSELQSDWLRPLLEPFPVLMALPDRCLRDLQSTKSRIFIWYESQRFKNMSFKVKRFVQRLLKI